MRGMEIIQLKFIRLTLSARMIHFLIENPSGNSKIIS